MFIIKYPIFKNLQLNDINLGLLGTNPTDRMTSFNQRALKSLSCVVTSNMLNMAHRNVEVSVVITTCIDFQLSSCTLQTQIFSITRLFIYGNGFYDRLYYLKFLTTSQK